MATIINADTVTGLKLYSDTSGQLELQSAGSTKVTMDTSGKVGIGTGSPASKFHVSGAGSTYAKITSSNAGSGAGLYFQNATANYLIGAGPVSGGSELAFYDVTNSAERMRIDNTGNLKFNSGYGSVATAYGCRAWVNFNGTGTVAIRDSGNVSSITDNGTGNYTVNFTTAMPDANYAVTGVGARASSGSYPRVPTFTDGDTKSTSAFKFYMVTAGSATGSDVAECNIAIFR
tara:strand:- start:42 stop:737 length:696 start_codon:yes stop_codon:yes gene_type:complete